VNDSNEIRSKYTKEQIEAGKGPGGGSKFDTDKPKYSLVPWEALEGFVDVLNFGAKKYGPEDWKGVEPVRYRDSLMRHVVAHMKGEILDEESGMSHLDHAMCNLVFLKWFEMNQKEKK
jgi:hypothetical protein